MIASLFAFLCGFGVENERVLARAAEEGVVAEPTEEKVVPRTAYQHIGSQPTTKPVGARSADDRVRSRAARACLACLISNRYDKSLID